MRDGGCVPSPRVRVRTGGPRTWLRGRGGQRPTGCPRVRRLDRVGVAGAGRGVRGVGWIGGAAWWWWGTGEKQRKVVGKREGKWTKEKRRGKTKGRGKEEGNGKKEGGEGKGRGRGEREGERERG